MKFIFSALILALSFSTFTSAANAAAKRPAPKAVQEVASKMKQDVRTIIHAVKNTDGNPCMSEGTSYDVLLQVRKQVMSEPGTPANYVWETVRKLNVDPDGSAMEVCQE